MLLTLIDKIEKFINEHASADVLREHLAFIKSQAAALEKDKIELQTKLENSQKEKAKFQSLLNKATEEIDRLNLLIEGFKQKDQKKYDEVTGQIIRYFFDAGRDLSVNDIVSSLSLNISVVQYHFDLLLKDKLITITRSGGKSFLTETDEPDMYALTPDGREYVVKYLGT